MIQDTLAKMRHLFEKEHNLSDESKKTLLELTRELETELAQLAKTDAESANAIATHTVVAANQNLSENQDSDSNQEALKTTLASFEASHPKLTSIVNRMLFHLSNLGI